MSLLDLDSLLEPVSSTNPAGELLEDDAAFRALERAAEGRPEQLVGQTVMRKAEPPDWPSIREDAVALLARTKDLRLAVHVTRALLQLEGFEGFARGLALIRGLLERFWPTVFPLIDVEEGDDPTARITALAALSEPTQLVALRSAPLILSPVFGPVSLRRLDPAEAPLADGSTEVKPVEPSALAASFQDVPVEQLEATAGAIQSGLEHLAAIEAAFEAAASSSSARSALELLHQATSAVFGILRQASGVVTPRLTRRLQQLAPENGQNSVAGEPIVGANGSPLPGTLRSRDDVLRAIDQICAYYSAYEPSSPVPLLLRRCRRLVNKDFVDIVKDLAPEALAQIETIAGKSEAGSGETS
jgi:type VI secretion system protein ImpA